MNPYTRGKNAYKQAAVNTTDQTTLILMLYDGTIRFLKIAIKKIQAKDLEGAHVFIGRAKRIVSELRISLDVEKGGEVGKNLHGMYTYMFNQLVDANIHKDAEKLEEVQKLMEELRNGWKNISNLGKSDKIPVPKRYGSQPILVKG